jgi:Tol biopolymer transport system component
MVFINYIDSNNEIYIVNSDGTNPTRLTNNNIKEDFPALSYDQTKIVYAAYISNAWNIFVMKADGTGNTQLTYGSFSKAEPAWSPDGNKIIYSNYTNDLYIMNADGTGTTRVTYMNKTLYHPRFFPDGQQIVFADGQYIYKCNIDGSNLTQLTNTSYFDSVPDVSFDGSKISFIRSGGAGNRVWIMNPDGTNP